jgi:hypothetical protein
LGIIRVNARPLDVFSNDLSADHVVCDDMCYALSIHSIIQSRCAPRAW